MNASLRLFLFLALFSAGRALAEPPTSPACEVNAYLRSALEAATGLGCQKIGTAELLKVNQLAADLGGSTLRATDFPPGLLPQSLTLSNIGNASMVGVLAPLSRVRNLSLNLSFMGQAVDFRQEEYTGYFKDLDLQSLSLDHFQMIFRETFGLDPEHFLGDQNQTTRLKLHHTNIRYLPFRTFDGVSATMHEVDLADNQIDFFVGEVIGELPRLESVDLSGNPLDTATFAMPIKACGDVKIKACRMGAKFDRATFLSRVTRAPGATCLCDGGSRPCEIRFDFCDAAGPQ